MKTMTKMLLLSLELTFLIINFFNKFKNCIKNGTNRQLQKTFNDKKYSLLHYNQKKLKIS